MSDLKTYFKEAEDKWMKELFIYCQQLFQKIKVPSHDHTHHARVWNYSKEIIDAISPRMKISYELVESVLIASLFHDTGLTVSLNENHGIESRKICKQYFDENKVTKPHQLGEILYAIEMHDDKDYKLNINNPGSLLSILCNADDLDAFGKVGILRYTEIYLLRGINMNELSQKVIENLDKRFLNFERTYQSFQNLYQKHKKRYSITKEFFEQLSDEVTLQ